MMEINEAGCIIIKLSTSCLFVVDEAMCLRGFWWKEMEVRLFFHNGSHLIRNQR